MVNLTVHVMRPHQLSLKYHHVTPIRRERRERQERREEKKSIFFQSNLASVFLPFTFPFG